MMLHRASIASGLGAVLLLCWVSCVSGDYPICTPGFLASDDANSMEIFGRYFCVESIFVCYIDLLVLISPARSWT